MKLERMVGELVRVTWQDACGSSEWRTEREATEMPLSTIVSVGYLLAVTKEVVHMCADRDENGNVNQVGVIPRGWVTKVERLGVT